LAADASRLMSAIGTSVRVPTTSWLASHASIWGSGVSVVIGCSLSVVPTTGSGCDGIRKGCPVQADTPPRLGGSVDRVDSDRRPDRALSPVLPSTQTQLTQLVERLEGRRHRPPGLSS